MTTRLEKIFAGVDTHADTHHAAVIDSNGKQLGDAQFPTTPAGYAALAAFLTAFGMAVRVGVEGTGSYGAGLTRFLTAAGFVVVEVLRPNRQLRRTRGKSDPLDAYSAARSALAQNEHATPKTGAGPVEAIRYLLVARRSAVKARTAAIVQIKSLLVTAPDSIRERYRVLGDKALIEDLARLRPVVDPVLAAIGRGLKSIARRHQQLGEEIAALDVSLVELTAERTRDWSPRKALARSLPRNCWSPQGTIPTGCATKRLSRPSLASARSRPRRGKRIGIV